MDILAELFRDAPGTPDVDPEPEAITPRHVSIAMTNYDVKILRYFYFKMNGRQMYVDGSGQQKVVTDWNHVYRAILQQLYVLEMNTPRPATKKKKSTS